MHTQVLILFGVDKYLVVVITRAMPSFLDHVYQILSGDSVPAVCPLRYFLLLSCAGFAKSTYSIHINDTASTKMIQLYHRYTAESMPCETNALP